MDRAERESLKLRLLSAIVLAPLAIAAVWLGGALLALLVIAAAAGMGWEWARLTGCGGGVAALIVLTAVASPAALALGAGWAALGLAGAGTAGIFIAARLGQSRASIWAALGTAWIVLPCTACLAIAGGTAGRLALLWLFFTVWATDSGAFIAGKSLGGPRMAPSLSPNKTWAGFAGGLAAAAGVAWATAWLAGADPAALVPAGMGLSVAAQIGDLAESVAKRRFGVKDSGSIIPGHGGLLDRLDGMLTAAAFEWLLTVAAGTSPLLWRVS